MNITLFGTSGQTGRLVVRKALENNHMVTAFVRDQKKWAFIHENLKLVEGSVFNKIHVSLAIDNAEAIISCLGGNDNDKTSI